MKKNIFWIFGILQSISLGVIIYLVFNSLNTINGSAVIGHDTHISVSITFPLFLLLTQYVIYSKRK